jgi:BirA family transcriptional regulator, biotin operon repressor / biotin---[acetyl-CoA-carboxylase] ligase
LSANPVTLVFVNTQNNFKQVLRTLREQGHLPLHEWPTDLPFSAEQLGLQRTEGQWCWVRSPEEFDLDFMRATLPDHDLVYFEYVDSTNTQLMLTGETDSVAGQVYLADFQFGGKGRRGRQWMSPFGRNLAISMGFATLKPLNQLGGMSLVVGLAIASVLENLGAKELALKWPNDVLLQQRKLGGVLIELIQRPQRTEFVVGFGINVALTAEEVQSIGQPVSDLHGAGVTAGRSALAVACVKAVSSYINLFESQGFAPFVSAFNDIHLYQGKTCTLIQGNQHIVGRVDGIGLDGELILHTQQGEQRFHGGEVSLRPPVA